jgi:hypothetical protein
MEQGRWKRKAVNSLLDSIEQRTRALIPYAGNCHFSFLYKLYFRLTIELDDEK